MTMTELLPLILLGGGAFLLIGVAVHFTGMGSLNNIKSKTCLLYTSDAADE